MAIKTMPSLAELRHGKVMEITKRWSIVVKSAVVHCASLTNKKIY